MSRNKKYAIRSALFNIETSLPKTKTKDLTWERDLIITANCAIWDEDKPKLARCLRRLVQASTERREAYAKTFALMF